MLARILALIAHEIAEEYRLLEEDKDREPPEPPDAHIKIGFSAGRKS